VGSDDAAIDPAAPAATGSSVVGPSSVGDGTVGCGGWAWVVAAMETSIHGFPQLGHTDSSAGLAVPQ
jgi:hypothetical protein